MPVADYFSPSYREARDRFLAAAGAAGARVAAYPNDAAGRGPDAARSSGSSPSASRRRSAAWRCSTCTPGSGPRGSAPCSTPGRAGRRRSARAWFGPDVQRTRGDEEGVAVNVQGDLLSWLAGALAGRADGAGVEVTPVALAFGTVPMLEVLTALRQLA